MNRIELFWNRFIEEKGYDKSKKYLEAFHFELTEDLANKLLSLVLECKKKATSSSFKAYEKEGSDLPKIADISIVTDWDGNPRCIIETKNITIIPFKDITYDICSREGEEDSLENWREGHIRFFRNE